MKTIIILLSLIFIGCAKDESRPVEQGTIESSDLILEPEQKIVAGIIRLDHATMQWYFIEDQNHSKIGLDRVETTPEGFALVKFNFTATKILSFVVSPDETYATNGIIAGASVGLDEARIHFSKPIGDLALPASNFFIYGVFE